MRDLILQQNLVVAIDTTQQSAISERFLHDPGLAMSLSIYFLYV